MLSGSWKKSNLISVIITTYNSEKYIKRCLKSVLNQTKFDLIKEIILVDDGSNDRTIILAKKIYSDIIIIKKKNSGPASSRNLGINYSKSKFICFLDADDFWHKDKIKIQAQNFKNNPNFDIYVCNSFSISGQKILGIRFEKNKIFDDNNLKEGIVKNYIRPEGRYSFHPPSSLMIKKKIFLKFGLYNEKLISVEDSEIFLRWVINKCKIYFNSKPLIFYEVSNQDSLTKNIDQWSKFHFHYWKNIDIAKLNLQEQKKFIIMKKNTLLGSIILVIKNGKGMLARKLIIQNFKILHCFKLYLYFLISFLPIYNLKKKFFFIFKR